MIIRAYQALYLGGNASQETGTSPPSCLLPENRLYIKAYVAVKLHLQHKQQLAKENFPS